MLLLGEQQRAHTLRAARYDPALIVTTVSQQLRVQFCKIACRRYGDPVVAPEVAPFDAALLVAFAGRAEIGLILPVRAKGNKASRQLAFIAAQDLLHRTGKVVVPKATEDAAKVMER